MFKLTTRKLLRSPVFTTGVVILLAWGIGSITALLSVVDAVCVRPLGVRHPGELVRIAQRIPGERSRTDFPYPFYRALVERTTDFSSVAGELDEQAVINWPEPSEEIDVHLETPEFFRLLGVPALYGRTLLEGDDTESSNETPAVLSFSFWRRRFNADPRAIGQTISLNRHPFVVVGVMPRNFNGLSADTTPDVRVPFRALIFLAADKYEIANPFVSIVARLKPHMRRETALASTLTIWRQAISSYWTQLDPSSQWAKEQLNRDLERGIQLDKDARGVSALRARYGSAWLLLSASGLILEIMLCANLATIILARNVRSTNNIALRLALGASRGHIFRLLLCESAILTAAGGLAGCLAAYGLIPVLVHSLPPLRDLLNNHIAMVIVVGRDWRPLLISVVLSAACFLGCGLAPAIRSSRIPIKEGLQGMQISRHLHRYRGLLLLQITICTILLACANLLSRTVSQLLAVDPGFDVRHILSFTIEPQLSGYTPDATNNLRIDLSTRIAELPGVVSVATARFPVLRGSGLKLTVGAHGETISTGEPPNTSFDSVSNTYFDTMGMKMIAGHPLGDAPLIGPRSATAVVVNEAFAQRFFGGVNPLGRCFGPPGRQDMFEVEGIVSNAKLRSLREPIQPIIYTNNSGTDRIVLYIRTEMRPEAIIASVRRILSALDPGLPVTDVATLENEAETSIADDRLNARLATAFAFFAVTLAGLGLYGIAALVVAQQQRDLAIRLALGAPRFRMVGVVAGQFAPSVAGGTIVGVCIVSLLGSAIRSLLYEVPPSDPRSIAATGASVLILCLVAALVPMYRAIHINPSVTLRQE
jgi:putative ABC transport system permease protein